MSRLREKDGAVEEHGALEPERTGLRSLLCHELYCVNWTKLLFSEPQYHHV